MPSHRKPALAQSHRPPVAGADRDGVGEQAGFFFLLGEAGEFGVQRVIGVEEGLLATVHFYDVGVTRAEARFSAPTKNHAVPLSFRGRAGACALLQPPRTVQDRPGPYFSARTLALRSGAGEFISSP